MLSNLQSCETNCKNYKSEKRNEHLKIEDNIYNDPDYDTDYYNSKVSPFHIILDQAPSSSTIASSALSFDKSKDLHTSSSHRFYDRFKEQVDKPKATDKSIRHHSRFKKTLHRFVPSNCNLHMSLKNTKRKSSTLTLLKEKVHIVRGRLLRDRHSQAISIDFSPWPLKIH